MVGSGSVHCQERLSRRAVLAGATSFAFGTPRISQTVMASTPVATPVQSGFNGRERLQEMLELLPSSLMPKGEILFDWVDFQFHFTSAGLAYPLEEAPPVELLVPVVSSDPLLQLYQVEEVRKLLGFTSLDVHQVLTSGPAPNTLQIYRGGVDFHALSTIWEAGGYEAVTGEYGDFWTRGLDGEVDFEDPLQRMVLARLNNIAILDDATIVCTPTAQLLDVVLRHANAGGKSIADSPDMEPLIERMPETTASGVALSGDVFAILRPVIDVSDAGGAISVQTGEEMLAESDDAVGAMPRIRSALGGVSAGVRQRGGDEQSAFFSLLPLSEAHADTVADVVFWRYDHLASLVTGEPYTDVLTIVNSAETAVDGPVVTIEMSAEDAARSAWYRMIVSRDVLMFAW